MVCINLIHASDIVSDFDHALRSVPLSLLTTDTNGKAKIDRSLLLDQREITIPLDTSKPFKLNAGTTGVCQ